MSPTPSLVGRFVVEHAALALTTRQVSREQVEHALTPTKQQRTILIVICAYVLGILILWNIPYVNIVLLPFKLVTVALHEFCHAAAGLCTGAKINLWDIVDDTVKRKVNESDATKFAQKTHCSSRFCGALWLLVALVFLVAAILLGLACRQHGHQNEPESVSREDRLRHDSPAQNDHSDERSGAHTPKRSRDELPGSSTLEPPHQYLATSSAVELRTKSPAEAGSMPGAKMPSEEIVRKHKELRAQLSKQQEKKRQEENIQPQLASEALSER
ncbi:hypothetical protein IW147_005333 [Coemansia sp. RSA 720]|nr:hypothetical protein IW147_005333 [Coemansia sp. RSA 720]